MTLNTDDLIRNRHVQKRIHIAGGRVRSLTKRSAKVGCRPRQILRKPVGQAFFYDPLTKLCRRRNARRERYAAKQLIEELRKARAND